MPSDAETGRLSRLEVTPSGKIINNNDGLTVLRHPSKRRSSSRSFRPQKVTEVVTKKSPDKNEDEVHANHSTAKPPSRKSSKTGKSVSKKKSKTIAIADHEDSSAPAGAKKGSKKALSASSSDSHNDTVKEKKSTKKSKAELESDKNPRRTATLPRVSAKIRKGRSSSKSVARRTSNEPDASTKKLKNNEGEGSDPKVSQSSHVNIRSLRVGRRSKSRTTTKQDWDESKPEPPFFQKITPDFYARLRQVASETPANILSSLKQARKNQLAKLETLTSLHDKDKKPNKFTKGQLSYAEAREALSFSKPAPLPDPTKRPDEDTKISSEPENVAKPLNGSVPTSTHTNGPTSGILCHGFGCGTKKHLRFAESTKELPAEASHSHSNNTRRLSCNVLGGCMK